MARLVFVRNKGRKARLTVELPVTTKDTRNPSNIAYRKPGRHLMGGMWYGVDPLSPQSFGKDEGQVGTPVGRVVGRRLASPYLLRRLAR